MVINVFEFKKYYFKRGDSWNVITSDEIWNYVPANNIFHNGLSGYRVGKSQAKSRIYSWVSLLWTPEYNGDGSFQLELTDTPQNRLIALNDQLMYDEDKSGTIMVVVSRQFKDKKIVLNGVSLHCYILSELYSHEAKTFINIGEDAHTFLYQVLTPFFSLSKMYFPSQFTAPYFPPPYGWDCVSASSLTKSYARFESATIDSTPKLERNISVWKFIRDQILRTSDIGFGSYYIDSKDIGEDALFNYGNITNPTFNYLEDASKNGGWIGFYVRKPGLNNTVFFQKERQNIIEEIYSESESSYTNDINLFVGDNLGKLGFYFEVITSDPYHPTAIVPAVLQFTDEKESPAVTRRSILIDCSSNEPEGYDEETGKYTESGEDYIKRMKALAFEKFAESPLSQNWKFTVIDPEGKVNLGDLIRIKSEYTNDVLVSRVTAITYKSQNGTTSRTLTVGTPAPKSKK